MSSLTSHLTVSPAFMMWLLGMYNTVSNLTTKFAATFFKVVNAVTEVFRPHYYILFNDDSAAYPMSRIVPFASGSARAAWIYCEENRTFYPWNVNPTQTLYGRDYKNSTLPILGLDITEGDKAAYDLTDFLEGVYVAQAGEEKTYPSLAHILAAWSLSSGIVLDPQRYYASFMDTSAEQFGAEIRDMRPVEKLIAEARAAAEQEEELEEGEIRPAEAT